MFLTNHCYHSQRRNLIVGNVCIVVWNKIDHCLSSCKWITQIDRKLQNHRKISQCNAQRDPSFKRDCVKASRIKMGLVIQEIYWRKYLGRKMRREPEEAQKAVMMQVWPQWRKEGRMEGGVRSILDCSAILRKFSKVAGMSLRQTHPPKEPLLRNGPDLVFLPCSVRPTWSSPW